MSAMETKSVLIVPLNGKNYATWKVQCRMALMKDNVWNIVNQIEESPAPTELDKIRTFNLRRDRALAIIVLSIDPKLLYLIGDPVDPTIV